MDNPYHPPLVSDALRPSSAPPRQGWAFIRFVLYSHLIGITISAGFTYADMHSLHVPRFIEPICVPLVFAAVISLLICPVLMLLAIARSNAEAEMKLGVFFLEGVLVAFHCWVLLRTVQ